MNTFILMSVLAVVLVIIAVIINYVDYFNELPVFAISLAVLFFFIAGLQGGTMFVDIPRDIDMFVRQKQYMESINAEELQAAGMVSTKVELNTWLYDAQYRRDKYGDWGTYPESVMELEPIK